MYTQVLVPLDGSSFGEAALPLAVALTQRTNAALDLVGVVEPVPVVVYDEWEKEAREWYEGYLGQTAERVRAEAGGTVTTALRSGQAVDTILAQADERQADLIVMATHGRGALSRAWLGSVADGVMRHARVPVLLLRPGEIADPITDRKQELATILVPLDGSDLSECALEHATELGELFGSAYHLTRVVPYPLDIPFAETYQTDLADARVAAADYLEKHADRMRRRGLRVTTSVTVDTQVGHGILAEADAVGCDMIAMATHGLTGVGRVVFGSAADKVLRGSHVPVLLYRPANVPAVTA